MEQERQQSSIDAVLTTLGQVREVGLQNAEKIGELVAQVKFQNGRVGKMEIENAEKRGEMRVMKGIVTAVVIAIIIQIIMYWLSKGMPH